MSRVIPLLVDIPLRTFQGLLQWNRTLDDIERYYTIWKTIRDSDDENNETYTKLRDLVEPITLLELLVWQTPDTILNDVMPIWKIRPDIDLYAFFVAGFGMDVI